MLCQILQADCILQVNAVQDVYLQIVYSFEIIDDHCICFNALMMTFGAIFGSLFRNSFRCLFWTDGLMQWHFKDTAKHQSQDGWMACISYDTFIILARHQGLACAFWLRFSGHLGTKINNKLALPFHCISLLPCAFLFLICVFNWKESDECIER